MTRTVHTFSTRAFLKINGKHVHTRRKVEIVSEILPIEGRVPAVFEHIADGGEFGIVTSFKAGAPHGANITNYSKMIGRAHETPGINTVSTCFGVTAQWGSEPAMLVTGSDYAKDIPPSYARRYNQDAWINEVGMFSTSDDECLLLWDQIAVYEVEPSVPATLEAVREYLAKFYQMTAPIDAMTYVPPHGTDESAFVLLLLGKKPDPID